MRRASATISRGSRMSCGRRRRCRFCRSSIPKRWRRSGSCFGGDVSPFGRTPQGARRRLRLRAARGRAYNSLMVFGHGGDLAAVYDKIHLVPFGEYLPFQAMLEAIGFEQLTRMRGGFTAGAEPRPLLTVGGLPPSCRAHLLRGDLSGRGRGARERPACSSTLRTTAGSGTRPARASTFIRLASGPSRKGCRSSGRPTTASPRSSTRMAECSRQLGTQRARGHRQRLCRGSSANTLCSLRRLDICVQPLVILAGSSSFSHAAGIRCAHGRRISALC